RSLQLTSRAACMRAEPTATEALVWELVRGSRLGSAFRRQVVLGEHIADFVCPSRRLVVEVDGGYHAQRARADARRDRALERLGYRVLRVPAEEVHTDLAAVALRILEALR
ncbi:MAG: DUF559 domain-containing protein, partial [Polyangiaceae bacterium]